METYSALLAICVGNSPVTGEFPTQRPVTRIFDVFFDLRLIKSWENNREAGDLRRHHVHYDVTVMLVHPCGSKNVQTATTEINVVVIIGVCVCSKLDMVVRLRDHSVYGLGQ